MRYCRARPHLAPCLHGVLAVAGVAALVACVIAFAVPLFRALCMAFGTGRGYVSAYLAPRMLCRVALYTVAQAACSTAIALAVGLWAAYYCATRRFALRGLLMSFAAVPLCMPVLIVALGYVSAFGVSGYVNRVLVRVTGLPEPPLTLLYSFCGIIVAQGFYNFPVVMAVVSDAWSQMEVRQEEAAMLLGAGKARVFFTVTLPKLLPAILSACMPVFLFCFFSFMMVLFFGPVGWTTFEVAIYHAGRTARDYASAARLAVAETALALTVLAAWNHAEKRAGAAGLSLEAERGRAVPLGARDAPGFALFALVTGVLFVLPLASVLLSSVTSRDGGVAHLSLAPWKSLFTARSFWAALRNTVTTACFTACLCTASATACSVLVAWSRRRGSVWGVLPMLPMAVSSVIMGLGMGMTALRGTQASLVLAQSALFWPFAFRSIVPQVQKIPRAVQEGALLLSPHRLDVVFRVIVPQCARPIAGAFALSFAISAGDGTLPLVLSVPGFDTLSLLVYRLSSGYRESSASVAGFLLALLCMGAFGISSRLRGAGHVP